MPVTRQNISGNARTATLLASSSNGVAPHYAVRAFVAFNGTGAIAILSSKNVSSITDGGTGAYRVNLTSGIIDNQFATWINGQGQCTGFETGARTANSVEFQVVNTTWQAVDSGLVSVGVIQ